jgi:Na+/H+-dicarboxylate symporter
VIPAGYSFNLDGTAIYLSNLIGNGVSAIVVGKWCGQVDATRLAEDRL